MVEGVLIYSSCCRTLTMYGGIEYWCSSMSLVCSIAELLVLVWLKLFLHSEGQIELPACTNEVRIQMILDGKYNIIRRT